MLIFNLFAFSVAVLAAIGWVMNILALVAMPIAPVTTLAVLRGAGIIVPPLGAIMGWFF